MTERGLKNINVFYSTFTNVFFLIFVTFFTFFNVFYFVWNVFYIYDFDQILGSKFYYFSTGVRELCLENRGPRPKSL